MPKIDQELLSNGKHISLKLTKGLTTVFTLKPVFGCQVHATGEKAKNNLELS